MSMVTGSASTAASGTAGQGGLARSTSAPVGRGSRGLSGRVYDQLVEAIVSLRYVPGSRLSEKDLAADLGVSRTPVRDALYRLHEEGLVDVFPQHGTFVSRIDGQSVIEAQFVREALERAALRQAIERLTDEAVVDLQRNLDFQRVAVSHEDYREFYALDEALHRGIYQISGHPGVWRMAQSVWVQLRRVRLLSLPQPRRLEILLSDHTNLVEAIQARDFAAADTVLTDHVRAVLHQLDSLKELHSDYFVG